MSQTVEILDDPTRTRYLEDQWASKVVGRLEEIEGTLLAQPDINFIYDLLGAIDDPELLWSFLYFVTFHSQAMIRIFVERGLSFATDHVRILSPLYSQLEPFTGLSTPADYAIYNECLMRNNQYFADMSHQLRSELEQIIERHLPMDATSELIQQRFNFSKNRANMIARTETLHSFNDAARKRYKQFGILQYQFVAHADACTDPKTLRDGTVVEGGCMELHGQNFPIDDEIHQPPIHPNCRCVIIPILPI